VSFFDRPFGTPAQGQPSPPSPTLAEQLARDWEIVEGRLQTHPQEGSARVSDFLRRWGVALAQAEPAQQGSLASMLESARASLLSQVASAGESARHARWEEAEARQRATIAQAEHQRRMEAGKAEVRRLQEETTRIQNETWRASQAASERNHQLAKAALFPEQHCPYCARSYMDLTGGCWHCQRPHRPGYF
jgi:hypothetical protein